MPFDASRGKVPEEELGAQLNIPLALALAPEEVADNKDGGSDVADRQREDTHTSCARDSSTPSSPEFDDEAPQSPPGGLPACQPLSGQRRECEGDSHADEPPPRRP